MRGDIDLTCDPFYSLGERIDLDFMVSERLQNESADLVMVVDVQGWERSVGTSKERSINDKENRKKHQE